MAKQQPQPAQPAEAPPVTTDGRLVVQPAPEDLVRSQTRVRVNDGHTSFLARIAAGLAEPKTMKVALIVIGLVATVTVAAVAGVAATGGNINIGDGVAASLLQELQQTREALRGARVEIAALRNDLATLRVQYADLDRRLREIEARLQDQNGNKGG